MQAQDAENKLKHEEIKLKKARHASAPPAVSCKEAAARLERMKPTSGITRKVLCLGLTLLHMHEI